MNKLPTSFKFVSFMVGISVKRNSMKNLKTKNHLRNEMDSVKWSWDIFKIISEILMVYSITSWEWCFPKHIRIRFSNIWRCFAGFFFLFHSENRSRSRMRSPNKQPISSINFHSTKKFISWNTISTDSILYFTSNHSIPNKFLSFNHQPLHLQPFNLQSFNLQRLHHQLFYLQPIPWEFYHHSNRLFDDWFMPSNVKICIS